MKRRILLLFAAVCLLCALLVSCGGETATTPGTATTTPGGSSATTAPQTVSVLAVQERVQVKDSELSTFDYTTLFRIEADGLPVPVEASYVDASAVGQKPGTYYVTCSYGGKQAVALIEITTTVYQLTLSVPSVSLTQTEAAAFDALSLFSATADGEPYALTPDMAETDFCDEVGQYTYTVTCGDKSLTLSIEVRPDHLLEVLSAYRTLEVTLAELEDFDYVGLFSLYVDGLPVQVTADMVDATALSAPEVGESYVVSFSYTQDRTSCQAAITVRVVEPQAISVTARSVVTYPNSPVIDLTTLFVVQRGDEILTVTQDMIEGTVDYTGVGVNEITLNYPGCAPATATVEIRRGVVILAPETVTVRRGTDASQYPFAADFTVIVNGLRFTDLPASCFDLSQVDFGTAGTYPVTLTIRYNEDKLTGISGNANYSTYEKTINYHVTSNTYTLSLGAEEVVLPAGTQKYDIYANLHVTVNGRNQTLTENPAYVDAISCYVRRLSDPLDFASAMPQQVRVAVYVNGPEEEPVEVTYTLRIDSGIEIAATGAYIFAGAPLSIKDLFSVTQNGEPVPVTYDMISGKVDIFTPGIYRVTLSYQGMEQSAQVVVFDRAMLGTYHTALTTIATEDDEDEEGYITSGMPATTLADLVISEDGSITLGNRTFTVVGGTDPHTIKLLQGWLDFTLYYEDGIIVLDPDNSIRMSFSEENRPMVYFHRDVWNIDRALTVNYGSAHVLQETVTTYSIDTFHLTSTDGAREMWYGLKIHLASRVSSDTDYVVTWGEASYPDDFVPETGAVSTLTFGGQAYAFTMQSNRVGKINHATNTYQWANRIFYGTVDGKDATLVTNQYEHYTLTVDGQKIFTIISNDISQMKNGGVDYATGRVFLYDPLGDDEYEPFSYQFLVDPETNTFTYIPRDEYYGRYELEIGKKKMYIFLDGYGTGVVNFDTTSYSTTRLSYTAIGRELSVTYTDTLPGFAYGTGAAFYTSPLLNLLTVKEMPGLSLDGQTFVNCLIEDGAIVKIDTTQIGAGSNAKTELLNAIHIITKNGELTGTDKTNCLVTNAVKFTAPGFYQYTVTVPVGGVPVTCYYAVQVLEEVCASAPVTATWGKGTLGSGAALALDAWGRVTLTMGEVTYTGLADVAADGNSFTAFANAADRVSLFLRGTLVQTGILRLQISGGTNMTEYFTTGTCRTVGCAGSVLRAYTVGEHTWFRLASSVSGEGKPATVTVVSGADMFAAGAVLEIATADTILYAKVSEWGNTSTGLVPADSLRGTYTCEGGEDLVLDGFGRAVCGSFAGTYRQSGGLLIVTSSDTLRAYRTNAAAKTYTEVSVSLDATAFADKTYVAKYTFVCDYGYEATTSFTFHADGTVTVTSVSPAHDDPTSGCVDDLYDPPFASAKGTSGTFTVSLDCLTVHVNGYTFTFRVADVVNLTRLTALSATVPSDAHGYFGTNTDFVCKE